MGQVKEEKAREEPGRCRTPIRGKSLAKDRTPSMLGDAGLCRIRGSLKTLVRVSTEKKCRKSVTELGKSGKGKLSCTPVTSELGRPRPEVPSSRPVWLI